MLFCRDTRSKLFTSNAIGQLLGLAGALVIFNFRGPAFAEISLAEAQGRYANSTVFIAVKYETLNGQTPTSGCKKGSGFLISESGYVVTSYHLFTDEKHRPFDKINAVLGKVGESFDCDQPLGEVVRLDRVMSMAEVDAALLKFVSPKRYVPIPACLGPVVANGSPPTLRPRISVRAASGVANSDEGQRYRKAVADFWTIRQRLEWRSRDLAPRDIGWAGVRQL
jgi:S1-C subfamily serine protease